MASSGTAEDDVVIQHPTMPISKSDHLPNGDIANGPETAGHIKPEVAKAEVPAYERIPDDFFRTIFYFSGMGTVIGSALSEGVHVEERQRGKGIDVELLPANIRYGKLHSEEYPLVVTCREQAHNLYDGLKNLHELLDNVPTYRENTDTAEYRPTIGLADVKVDEPIHGPNYFTRIQRMRERQAAKQTDENSTT